MGALNVRVDPQTAALVERVARESGLTKSEVVRQALATLRERGARATARYALRGDGSSDRLWG